MSVLYRTSQFIHALSARPSPADLALAEAHLPASLHPLFERLNRAEQAHALRVLRALLAQGHRHPDLLAAALLHDVGKSRVPLSLLERVLIVLARQVFRQSMAGWGDGDPQGWRRPFVVAARHPEWGAEMILQAGGSHTLAALVRRHQVAPPIEARREADQLLLALQAADAEN